MMNPNVFERKAIQHTVTCFLNSLLREWNSYQISTSSLGTHIDFPLHGERALLFPLEKESLLGRHTYIGTCFLKKVSDVSEISFEETVNLLCDFFSGRFETKGEQVNIFKERVFSSLRNIRNSLEFREDDLQRLALFPFTFKEAEQGLMVGHNFHPTPKSRDEFDDEDLLSFSPEFGGKFRLEWFLADPSILYQRYSASFGEQRWSEELACLDLERINQKDLPLQGMVPIPMHPWQLRVLLKNPIIQEYKKSARLLYLGASKTDWHPTSSLRSIYREDAPYMVKFSMSVKLTNSIRHLFTREVERGLQLRDVLSTLKGSEFLSANPNFKVVTEPAYFCFKDGDGCPLPESIVVCRENPFLGNRIYGKAVLATLTQDGPLGGKNLIQKLILTVDQNLTLRERTKKWFAAYLDRVVRPLILAQANYGIILGAHQQNLILDLEKGYPTGAYFRDCQGTGYSELGYALFSKEVSLINRENGNVVSEKMGNYLFSYYLILNSTFNVITASSSCNWISEKELLEDLRAFLENIRSHGVRDSSCLDYLLDEDSLMHKGNFLCSFKNINENTTEDPLSIYTPVKNPILSIGKEKEKRIYA